MVKSKVQGRQMKKAKDPNKPKRATSAYFFFLEECRQEAKSKGRSISKIAEFTKECSSQWREMDDKSKKKFNDKAAADKARYDAEMKNYGGGSTKQAKDPNQPKKPLTAYFLFLADFRKEKEGENIANKELLKLAGLQWRDLTDEEKQPYEKKSQEEQKKYEKAMAEYRRTGGAKSNGGAAASEDDDMEDDDDEEEEDEDSDE